MTNKMKFYTIILAIAGAASELSDNYVPYQPLGKIWMSI